MTGNYDDDDDDDDDETNFQRKILLTVHKFQKFVKTFAKSSWANIKFLKTKFSKSVQLERFLFDPSIQPIKEMTSLVNSVINSSKKE